MEPRQSVHVLAGVAVMLGFGCFRHQVLLRCDRHVHDSGSCRPTQVSERQHVAQPPDNVPHGHEDVPKGQPPRGESRLHRRRPHLAAEPQRPMRPYEVVVATQQLEMRVERVGRACMGQRVLAPLAVDPSIEKLFDLSQAPLFR